MDKYSADTAANRKTFTALVLTNRRASRATPPTPEQRAETSLGRLYNRMLGRFTRDLKAVGCVEPERARVLNALETAYCKGRDVYLAALVVAHMS